MLGGNNLSDAKHVSRLCQTNDDFVLAVPRLSGQEESIELLIIFPFTSSFSQSTSISSISSVVK